MTGQDDQFKQAVEAFKAGRKDEARDLLMDIVDKNERHEQAWLYLSALVDSDEERQICLENVLEINPNNDRARKGLEKVKQKIAQRPPDNTSVDSTASSEPSSPFPAPDDLSADQGDAAFSTLDWDTMPSPADGPEGSSSAPIGAEFGSSSGDALVDDMPGGFPSPESFTPGGTADDDSLDWLHDDDATPSFPAADQPAGAGGDPFAVPSMDDWGAGDPASTSGSTSGEDMSSTQEYDSWVQTLNEDEAGASTAPAVETAADNLASPFTDDAPGPFGDTDFMLGDETLGATGSQSTAESGADAGAFGGDVFGSGAEPSWDSSGAASSRPGTAEVADSYDPFSADTAYDDASSPSTPAGQRTKSLFDEDYADDNDNDDFSDAFGGATTYEPDFGDDDDDLSFSFDEVDDSLLGETPTKSTAESKGNKRAKREKKGKSSKATPAIDPVNAKYFALIPAEIKAKGGSGGNSGVIIGILLMVALNAAGYAAYFLELI